MLACLLVNCKRDKNDNESISFTLSHKDDLVVLGRVHNQIVVLQRLHNLN